MKVYRNGAKPSYYGKSLEWYMKLFSKFHDEIWKQIIRMNSGRRWEMYSTEIISINLIHQLLLRHTSLVSQFPSVKTTNNLILKLGNKKSKNFSRDIRVGCWSGFLCFLSQTLISFFLLFFIPATHKKRHPNQLFWHKTLKAYFQALINFNGDIEKKDLTNFWRSFGKCQILQVMNFPEELLRCLIPM